MFNDTDSTHIIGLLIANVWPVIQTTPILVTDSYTTILIIVQGGENIGTDGMVFEMGRIFHCRAGF